MNKQFAADMKALSEELTREFEDKKARLGEDASEAEKQQLQSLRKQLGRRINQARREGQANIAKATSEVRQAYLDDIMSVAQAVALEHGARVVLKAMAVLWSDEHLNITDEVIGRMDIVEVEQPAEESAEEEQEEQQSEEEPSGEEQPEEEPTRNDD